MKCRKREMLCFLIAGSISVVVDYVCYQGFMEIFSFERSIAKGISFFCGAAAGFVLNKVWTFQSAKSVRRELPKYISLYLCTAWINARVNQEIVRNLNNEIFGFLVATGVSTVLNFLGQKFFVFAKGKKV